MPAGMVFRRQDMPAGVVCKLDYTCRRAESQDNNGIVECLMSLDPGPAYEKRYSEIRGGPFYDATDRF